MDIKSKCCGKPINFEEEKMTCSYCKQETKPAIKKMYIDVKKKGKKKRIVFDSRFYKNDLESDYLEVGYPDSEGKTVTFEKIRKRYCDSPKEYETKKKDKKNKRYRNPITGY